MIFEADTALAMRRFVSLLVALRQFFGHEKSC
jgi:hypothetical protein